MSTAQQHANKHQRTVYRYQLANGNTFCSFEIIKQNASYCGSVVQKMIETARPYKQ